MATYTDNYNLTKPTFAESADIRTINGNMDTIDDVLHASQVSLADAYDETRTSLNSYKKDDIVMYELLMYKCLEDGVYGTWDGTKWERTTAGANGGGSDVTVTPSYNSGTKIAEIDVDGDTEEIYVPAMTGASSGSDGASGLVPAPQDGDEDKYLKGNGTWAEVGGGADYIELTQAEYDALTPAEKTNGKMYFITDGNADTASGGSGFSEKILFEQPFNTAFPSTITLSESFEDFDALGFYFTKGDDNNYYDYLPVKIFSKSTLTEALNGAMSGRTNTLIATGLQLNDSQYARFQVNSTTQLTTAVSGGAWNLKKITGIKFGSGGSGGGSGDNDDLSNKTWTLITSTTGTSAEIDIPSGTEWLVLTAEMGGRVSEVGKERMSNINKLMDVAQLTIWGKGYEWADTLGNHTTISMAVNGGKVSIKSGYNTVTAKVYAVS